MKDLVRPYVLGLGRREPGPPPEPGQPPPDGQGGTGGYRLIGEWPAGQAPHRLLDEAAESGWHQPGAAGSPGPGAAGPGHGADRPIQVLARHRWTLAIASLGVLGLASSLLLLDAPRSVLRTEASGCAAAFCPAPTPGGPSSGPATSAAPGRGRRAAHPGPGPRATLAAATAPASSPAPSRPASTPRTLPPATAPPPPAVSLSYTLVQHWDGGFQGEFTIVNNSAAAIDGWQLSAVLPGDTVDTVWDASYRTSGDTLLMSPPSYQVTIPAGGTLTENFTANGNSTSPAGCTFNGVAGC